MTDPGSQRSKRMPQNCPAEIADENPSRRQFVDLKLIDHGRILQFLHCKHGDEQKKSKILNFVKKHKAIQAVYRPDFGSLWMGVLTDIRAGNFEKPRKTQIMPLPLHCFSPFIQVTRNNKLRKTVI